MKMKSAEIAPKLDERKSVEIKHFVWHFSHYFSLFQTLGPLEIEVVKALRKAEAASASFGTQKAKKKVKRRYFCGRPRPERIDGEQGKYRYRISISSR